MHVKAQLIIPAAGMGVRLGASEPKALITLAGKPLLVRTLERFARLRLITNAIIMIPPGTRETFQACLSLAFPGNTFRLLDGGAERQDSVARGLAALEADTEIVAVHDAARPFVPLDSVTGSIEAAVVHGAATVAVRSIDTILIADGDAFLCETPDRSVLWACQTPQVFRVAVLRDAHTRAAKEGFLGTDDASLVRRAGGRVKLVTGSPLNFKITTPHDRALAQCVIEGNLV